MLLWFLWIINLLPGGAKGGMFKSKCTYSNSYADILEFMHDARSIFNVMPACCIR